MTTLYQNPSLKNGPAPSAGPGTGYNGYIEPDTNVPPKARPVLKEISVNGIAINEADILAEAQNHPAESPGAALIEAARALVVRELLLQEARRLGIEAAQEASADGRMETPEDAAIHKLVEMEVAAPSAGEDECRRFYDNNASRFLSEAIHEARHILLAAPENDENARHAAKSLAHALLTHLKRNPQNFAAIAAEYSDCPSRDQGGNLGQLMRGSTVPEFERALVTMAEGTILPHSVESRFGFHIVFLERRIPEIQLPFDQVRDRIAGWLEAASWSRAVSQYIAVLAGRAEIRGIEMGAAEGPLIQ